MHESHIYLRLVIATVIADNKSHNIQIDCILCQKQAIMFLSKANLKNLENINNLKYHSISMAHAKKHLDFFLATVLLNFLLMKTLHK